MKHRVSLTAFIHISIYVLNWHLQQREVKCARDLVGRCERSTKHLLHHLTSFRCAGNETTVAVQSSLGIRTTRCLGLKQVTWRDVRVKNLIEGNSWMLNRLTFTFGFTLDMNPVSFVWPPLHPNLLRRSPSLNYVAWDFSPRHSDNTRKASCKKCSDTQSDLRDWRLIHLVFDKVNINTWDLWFQPQVNLWVSLLRFNGKGWTWFDAIRDSD